MALAMETRCCCPPESCPGRLSHFFSSPRISMISRIYLLSTLLLSSFRGRMIFSHTFSMGIRLNCWKTNPIFLLRKMVSSSSLSSSSCFPSMTTLPLVGTSRPPSRFRSVDFPLPEVPTIARNSPFSTDRFTPSSAATSDSPLPYTFLKFFACKITILFSLRWFSRTTKNSLYHYNTDYTIRIFPAGVRNISVLTHYPLCKNTENVEPLPGSEETLIYPFSLLITSLAK